MTREEDTTPVQNEVSRNPSEVDDEQSLDSIARENPTSVSSMEEQAEPNQREHRSARTTEPETETTSQTTTAQIQEATETADIVLDLVRAESDLPTIPFPLDTLPDDEESPHARENEFLPEKIIREVKESFATSGVFTTSGMIVPDELDPEFEAFIEEQWFDFTYLEDREIVEHYWVNRPYAYVTVLYNPGTRIHRYHVSEPNLDTFEQYVRDDLVRILRNSLMYESIDEEENRDTVFADKAASVIAEHAATVTDGSIQKLFYYVMRDFLGFGKIDPLMYDPAIEDISCDGTEVPVFIYHHGYRDLRTNIRFERQTLNSLVVRLAQRAG